MSPTCIALDLDYTLSHFQGKYEGLFDIFRKRGVPDATIHQAYEEAKTSGFTIEKLIDLVARGGASLDHSPILDEFRAWLKSAIALYPDVLPFFERLKKTSRIPTAIVTFGHPDHQKEKMRLLKFPYDRFVCTTEKRKKQGPLKELVQQCGAPIAYIDDSGEELDLIREADPEQTIITVRVLRPDAPHKDNPTRFKHIHISSLEELFDHVLQ